MTDKLEVGDIVGYEEEIGIVMSISPSVHRIHKLSAEIKWIGGDQSTTTECAYDPVGIHIIARASES
tara:strand:+ start:224 stop:424 length:201 start_codon:yes stop_codon:yes gene_type:complete